MRKKFSNSKRLAAAKSEHAKFLAKYGIDASGKPKLTGAVARPMTAAGRRQPTLLPTSDEIPRNGPARVVHESTGNHVIGQPYNKGPLMVLGSKAELVNGKRRDR